MDLTYPADTEQFRAEIRTWLEENLPRGWFDWTFWQYSGTGVVLGVRGKADLNAFYGSAGDWAGWLAARTR